MQISVQLYTLRTLCENDFVKTCQQARDIGFRFVELAGFAGMRPRDLKSTLDAMGLGISGSHVGGDALDNSASVIESHLELGCANVIVAGFSEPFRNRAEAWKRTVEAMQRAALQFSEAGLRLGFHNHAHDFAPMNGTNNWDYLFANAPSVFAEPDTHWVKAAGFDPADVIRGVKGRVPCVHFKDSLASGEMTDVGSGILDWDRIIPTCEESSVEFCVIEHDHPNDPIASIQNSFVFLKQRLRR